ncbi:hypothetical protein HJFPF1_11963 [Paramyrothecium foliicola]|nr:hypothetical protein HJFPF1_11963 [Paramyrothecium foliicola]
MSGCLAEQCQAATFNPSVFGAEILNINANLVQNYTFEAPSAWRLVQPTVELKGATFCNVTVTYTHPGVGDEVNIEAWLPTQDWNGMMQAYGGGGYSTGRVIISYAGMAGALHDGFVGISTDAGLNTIGDPTDWALKSPGNVDWGKLQNLAHVSLNDQAVIGKSIIKSFYGQEPEHSYWVGCSQGGRQGMMLAQRYPTAFDGIVVGAPGINWNEVFFNIQWPQQIMNELGVYPPSCELDAITIAATKFCDNLDGVVDGIVASPEECLQSFDPFSVVGEEVDCKQKNGTVVQVSEDAAKIVNATWHGIHTDNGRKIWHGLTPGTDLTGNDPTTAAEAVAGTKCTDETCTGVPLFFGLTWMQLFIARGNPEVDISALDRSEFIDMYKAGALHYGNVMGTADPDLTKFKAAGGKLISYHGLSDTLLSAKGTEGYYKNVAETVPDVDEFFKYFPIPGLGHCSGGRSTVPEELFAQLREWVEEGKAPEYTRVQLTTKDDEKHDRIACAFPEVAGLDAGCGDAADEKCWSCSKA